MRTTHTDQYVWVALILSHWRSLQPASSPALACIFGIPRLHFTCILPVSHRILGIPLYPCIDLYLKFCSKSKGKGLYMLLYVNYKQLPTTTEYSLYNPLAARQIHCIPYPTVSHFIQLYAVPASPCAYLAVAVSSSCICISARCISRSYFTASKTGYRYRYSQKHTHSWSFLLPGEGFRGFSSGLRTLFNGGGGGGGRQGVRGGRNEEASWGC